MPPKRIEERRLSGRLLNLGAPKIGKKSVGFGACEAVVKTAFLLALSIISQLLM